VPPEAIDGPPGRAGRSRYRRHKPAPHTFTSQNAFPFSRFRVAFGLVGHVRCFLRDTPRESNNSHEGDGGRLAW